MQMKLIIWLIIVESRQRDSYFLDHGTYLKLFEKEDVSEII